MMWQSPELLDQETCQDEFNIIIGIFHFHVFSLLWNWWQIHCSRLQNSTK